ncbi:3-oxoacyl-ACP synthase III family protein [Sporofaciens musculi]|uniref:3-oxoacyl-ACP synthase III family protein n=1 Tax=Sporofaciens musculi TaxID=2681861 RepID=UPI00256FC21B|nr:ketoacyl-ACP synthase III [Sporofaciens musculi]
MNIIRIEGVQIDGVYGCIPENMVDNEEALNRLFGEREAKNIVKATGIYKRTIADVGTSSLDLCVACAKRMIRDKVFAPKEIGAVVFVTFTPERILPYNAAKVQDMLGLGNDVASFDMGLACSGYVYGLWAAATLAKQTGRKVLLLDGDVQSAYLSGEDKSTTPVLSDAGTATVISADENNDSKWEFAFYTDGSGRDILTIPAGGSGMPTTEESLKKRLYDDGSRRRDVDIYMDGFEVFKFVAQPVSKFISEFCSKTVGSVEVFDGFVPHQANMYMIKQLARKLKIPWEKTWKSGDKVGNSASATIPITISMNADEMLQKNTSELLISGFGGGLSASAGRIELNKEAAYCLFHYGEE